MSTTTPDDLFWDGFRMGDPSLEHVEHLRQAAAQWMAEGRHFAAGMALSAVTHAGWGLLKTATRLTCVHAAIAAFRKCSEDSLPGSLDGLLALKKWSEELRYLDYDGPGGQQQLRRDTDAVYLSLAERLLSQFGKRPEAVSFLVYGFRLAGPVTGPWRAEFPGSVIDDSGTNFDIGRRLFCFRIPSAFRLFIRIGDYRAAQQICLRHGEAFTSPDLRGWRHAVEGFTDAVSAADAFHAAADAFEEDTPERGRDADGGWSSVNRDLWKPYFRSRSWMAKAVREPERGEECISAAAASMPPFRSYSHTRVHRYHLFVRALAGVLNLACGLGPAEARAEFEKEIRQFGDNEGDPAVLEFLDHAHRGFEELRADRRRGITAVGRAMAALDRVPLLGGTEAEAMRHALDRRAIGIIEGPSRLWIHRTLESIKHERKLHRVLLRLFQNSVPRYAQIRHGPIEYGKDIAVAAQDGDQLVLRMYQAKCGHIKKASWNKVRPQLEEIFQVPLASVQIPWPVHRRVGILVWNGYADPHVDPLMQAWQKDQLAAFRREYEFMHLDDIASYILDSRLVTAFREALAEVKIPIA
jgi:hypothetical protein